MYILVIDPEEGVRLVIEKGKLEIINIDTHTMTVELDSEYDRTLEPGVKDKWSMPLTEIAKHNSLAVQNIRGDEVLFLDFHPKR